MTLTLDWKFWTTLLATAAGVVVPIWLWQVDLNARAIELRLISTASLQPQETGGLKGLSISFNSNVLESPTVSVLEVVNSGSKPIQASDFEGPIEIRPQEGSKVVRVEVASTMPVDLRPQMSQALDVISIQPLLLNPKDKFVLTVLTSGQEPKISTRARIAGVAQVDFVDQTKSPRAQRSLWVNSTIGVLLLCSYAITLNAALFWQRVLLGRKFTFFSAVISCFGGVLLTKPFIESGLVSMSVIIVFGLLLLLAMGLVTILGRRLLGAF